VFKCVKKKVDETVSANDIATVIGQNTKIKGEITGDGNVRIDGHIEGGVATGGNVVIGEHGDVRGNIKAVDLIISGSVTGNVETEESLCIHASGQLIGDAKVKSLNVEDGGIFKGRSEMVVREMKPMGKIIVPMKKEAK
jgi:cytoskeletal protein CcmA (bactofilin family)